MKRFNLSWLFALSLILFISVAVAQEKLWVSSESAKLKQEKQISSRTISTLPRLLAYCSVSLESPRILRAVSASSA